MVFKRSIKLRNSTNQGKKQKLQISRVKEHISPDFTLIKYKYLFKNK